MNLSEIVCQDKAIGTLQRAYAAGVCRMPICSAAKTVSANSPPPVPGPRCCSVKPSSAFQTPF